MMFKHSRTTQRHDDKIVFVDTLTLPPRRFETPLYGLPKEYTLIVEVAESNPFIRIIKSMDTHMPAMSISREDLKDILTAVEWVDAGPLGRLAIEAKPTKRNKRLPQQT